MFLLSLLTNKDSYNAQIIQCVNDTIFKKRFRVPGFGTGSGILEPVPTSNHYPLTEFYPVQNSLYVQVLRSRILAPLLHALQQRGQPNFAAWYKERNYRTFAEGATYIWLGGHDVGHQPTF